MKRIFLFSAILFASLTSLAAKETSDFTGKVPANFTCELSFADGSPFTSSLTSAAEQTENGEAYELPFKQGKYSASLFFTLCKGPNGNTYSIIRKTGNLDFMRPESRPDNCGYVKIPAVSGRYVKSIEITVATKNTIILFCKGASKVTKGEGLIRKLEVEDQGTGCAEFTPEQAAVGAPVYMYRQSSGAFRFSCLKVTYASEKKAGKR